MRQNVELLSFNRGLVSPLALARTDLDKANLLAETYDNWLPNILGSMSPRPGTERLGNTKANNTAKYVPFTFAIGDSALLEFTAGVLRIWNPDTLVTRAANSALSILNGTFTTDLTSWTDVDETGATSQWATGGYMQLQGDGNNYAARRQAVTTVASTGYAVRVIVTEGECYLRIGSTAGGQEYHEDAFLYPGEHSFQFTATGTTTYIEVRSREAYPTLITSIDSDALAVLELPTAYTAGDLQKLRWEQSGDVIFLACDGQKPKRIERRANNSWSFVDYITDDGPFRLVNTTTTRLNVGALTGSTSLTATKPTFKSTHVGALFKATSQGQNQTVALSAADTYTDPIRVTGVSTDRAFTYTLSGTFVGTITLQRSVGDIGAWTDVNTVSLGALTYNDGFDNQIIYYRLGFKTGDYTSGTANIEVSYSIGAITGLARVTGYTSSTVVTVSILKPFGSIDATFDWAEGAWSDYRGYPSSVAIHESRLCWAGKDKLWATIVDRYHSFDEDFLGDAAPLSRSIGVGPVDTVRWLASAQGLVLGAQGAEWVARSSALNEPLTPTNFNLRADGTRGSADVAAVVVDHNILYVDRTGSRLLALSPQGDGYTVVDLAAVVPEVGEPTVTRIAVQRTPNTRIHYVRSDGTVAILNLDTVENVRCWSTFSTDGLVEDVVVLPRLGAEDAVYYMVARTNGASTYRYLEKHAKVSECQHGTTHKLADSFVHYSGAASLTVDMGIEYANLSVVVWADGADAGTFTVGADGVLTLTTAASEVVAGLAYSGQWKSVKLAYAAAAGSALTQRKRVDHLGLILGNSHYQGLRYGGDFSHLDNLPLIEQGKASSGTPVRTSYDADSIEFNGSIDTDSRVCLQFDAPRGATVLALVLSISTHDKI